MRERGRMELLLHGPHGAASSKGGKSLSSRHFPPSAPCPGTLSFLGSVWKGGESKSEGREGDLCRKKSGCAS